MDLAQVNQAIQKNEHEFSSTLERLQAWRTFVEQPCPHLLPLDPLLGFSHVLRIDRWQIALSGLNSAWTCADDQDTGQLWLAGQTQLEAQHQQLTTLLAGSRPDLRLCLIHHPLNCLNPSEAKALRARLENEFDLLLHGHAHDTWVTQGSIPTHSVISAGAATAETVGEFGYNWVEVGSDDGKVFLRRYDEVGAGWVKQTIAGRAEDGVWQLAHPRLPAPVAAPASAPAAIPDATAAAQAAPTADNLAPLPDGFADARSTPEQLAQRVFGKHSYRKRYQDSISHAHYFVRASDAELARLLAARRSVLVEGHPLAGKTRAVFQALQAFLPQHPHAVLWAFQRPAPGAALSLPTFPAHANPRIVWFDDFDQILHDLKETGHKLAAINQFLHALIDADCMLLASARTGPQNYSLQRRFGLDEHLWESLTTVSIAKLAGDEAQEFAAWYQQQFNQPLPDKFDHHPGSLFLDLETMRTRWARIDELANDNGVNSAHAKQLLHNMLVFYRLQAWQPGGLFALPALQDLARFQAEYGQQQGNALAMAFRKQQVNLVTEWDNVVGFLTQDRFHLGFLQTVLQDGQSWLQIETAYLDYVVGEDSPPNLLQTTLKQLDPKQRGQLGLQLTPYNLASLLPGKIHDEAGLKRLLASLKGLGLKPDVVGWNQIIHHCQSLPLAQQALLQCKNNGIAPDVVTWNSLLDKAANLEQAQPILQAMREANIAPDVVTWTSLLQCANNFKHCDLVLQLMQASSFVPNKDTWHALLARVADANEGQQILQLMRAAGVSPNEITYSILFKKAQLWEEIASVWDAMQFDQVPFFQYHFNKVVNKLRVADVEPAAQLLAELAQRIQPVEC